MLTDHSLRYYKDSIAEEVRLLLMKCTDLVCVFVSEICFIIFVVSDQASDLDGEIDLSTCYNVTEYQAQRNYGFQIHVRLN